jgi:gentisate 1,2-dioxygenase
MALDAREPAGSPGASNSVLGAADGMDAYVARLREAGLDAPWARPGPLILPKATRVLPRLWRWNDVEPLVRRSAEFVTPDRGAERRILRLDNPGVPERTATHTISVAIQYLLPGEVAPAHRHTPNAIRFMLRGQGAYTTVEGDRCEMHAGDLVLTPCMTWHDHGNDGADPAMWIDVLDSPVVRYLEALRMEPFPEDRQTAAVVGLSERRFGSTGLRPAWQPPAPPPHRHHLLHWRWDATEAALHRLAWSESSPFDDVIMEYVDPVTGRSLTPALGCYVQMLRPGLRTRAHRESSTAVYHVVRGDGVTTIDDVRFEWHAGDFLVVPPGARHAHANESREPAILFSVQDVPLLTFLGLYRMEADDGGRSVT